MPRHRCTYALHQAGYYILLSVTVIVYSAVIHRYVTLYKSYTFPDTYTCEGGGQLDTHGEEALKSVKRPDLTIPRYKCVDVRGECRAKEGKQKILPRAFIIGFAKCSTTALGWLLSLHPLIEFLDEPYYFNSKYRYKKGLSAYCEQVTTCAPVGGVLIDKTPVYVNQYHVLRNIYEYDPDARILVLVRDPVSRMLSHLSHYNGIKPWEKHRDKVWNSKRGLPYTGNLATKGAYYSRYLAPWLKYYPLNVSLLVINSDDVTRNPHDVIRRVDEFLGLPHLIKPEWIQYDEQKGFPCVAKNGSGAIECMSDKKGRPHAAVPPPIRDSFTRFYRPWNNRLYELVRQDFGWNTIKS